MQRLLPLVFAMVFAVVAWVRLVVQNSEVLFEAQDQNFWQPGVLYLQQMLLEPGGCFSWAGQYLTQYFYWPALGASLLIVLWLAIDVFIVWGCRLPWYLSFLGLLPGLVLLWAETSLGYWIYLLKVPDWWFTPTLFVCAVAMAMALARGLNRWVRLVWQVGCCLFLLFMGHAWLNEAQVPTSLRIPFHAMADDANYRAELRMERAAEEGNWSAVLTEMRQAKQKPTRAMWLFKNVALMNQGRLASAWLDYPCKTQLPAANDSVRMSLVETTGPLLYYYHGSIEFAYRWSMENMVEYGPSMKRLRLMTRCALLKGDYDVARKYLTLLQRTSFYSGWADQQMQYLNQPSLLAEAPGYKLALQLSQGRSNILDSDNGKVETYLLTVFAGETTSSNALLSEVLLVYAMQSQRIDNFWAHFLPYAELHKGQPMPSLIQQAVYLYQHLEPQSSPKKVFPFDAEVIQTNQKFQQRTQQLAQQGYSTEAIAQATQREFGKTFFWFYFFCRNLSTY